MQSVTHSLNVGLNDTHGVLCIGDLHGCYDLFVKLFHSIQTYLGNDLKEFDIVLLGDMIDRGAQSREILDWINEHHTIYRLHCLLGNHEQLLLQLLSCGSEDYILNWALWRANGGQATLRSLDAQLPPATKNTIEHHRDTLKNILGPKRLQILENLKTHFRAGRLLCVHGGIDPDLSIAENFIKPKLSDDPMHYSWIRDKFLDHQDCFEENVLVVHGHTVYDAPQVHHNRIALDTGACLNGTLSAALFLNQEIKIFQVSNEQGISLKA